MFLQVNEQEQKYDNFILIIIPFFIFRFVYVNFLLYSNLSREGCIHSVYSIKVNDKLREIERKKSTRIYDYR